jgi:eukaryotic-like serine/threonine-protein kinase
MTIAAGTHLGPYEILGTVGAGGMGEVFRAKDSRLGRDVAVKVLPTLFASDPDRLRRFEQEARAAAALNHPNILVVYDVGTETGVPYVVSELLDGQTLRQALDRGQLSMRKAIDYGTQIANGLAAAHEKGIVHRDLKPENVFVTKDGRVKILDFGLAKLAEAVTTDGSRATIAQTDPGLVVGTVGYMSPEQLRGEPVDARSDVFSLGAVLYEMFTGTRAFKGKTSVDTMSAILKEDPAEFPSGVHASSPALERIVRRCLEKNVEERFQSARDVTFALDALSTPSGIASGVIAAAPPVSRSRLVPAAAIVAAVVLAAAAYFAGTRFARRALDSPALTQLTFRNGVVESARFSPDGKTVIYSAAWEGEPITTFSTRPGSPESSALSIPPANLLAVSSTGEMALALNARHMSVFAAPGTLARASLSGGAPRELMTNVLSADWTADGGEMAVLTADFVRQRSRLQFPLNTERVELPYWLSDARVSPDGNDVAFIAHVANGDDGELRILGRSGDARTISKGWLSIQGLAWAPGGREIWVTGTRVGMLRALWAITLEGRERLVYRAPVRLTLQDIAPDGRVLLTGMTLRSEMRFGSLEQKTERDISWFDYATTISMSRDAKLIAFVESGEGAGSKYGVFVRPTDGGPAFRIADAGVSVISPDGKWVLVGGMIPTNPSAKLLPTGPGAARDFDLKALSAIGGGAWMSDSRHFVLIGVEKGVTRTYDLDTQTGRLTAVTPAGTFGRFVSPNGEWLPVVTSGTPGLFNLRTHTTLPSPAQTGDEVVGWSADSQSLFLMQRQQQRQKVFRVAVPAGDRTELATIEPADRAGLVGTGSFRVAPDGDHYVYHYFRELSQLYLVDLAGR